MIQIMKLKLVQGLTDAKFLFLSGLILIAFILNGLTFADRYQIEYQDYRANVAESNRLMQETLHNLQEFSIFEHTVVAPPQPLSFIATGGETNLPNAQVTSAFATFRKEKLRRGNIAMPLLPDLDWLFIVGIMGSLLAIVSGYSVFAEERQAGTFRQVMSNPVSRFAVFFGSYFGTLLVLLCALAVGMVVNLLVITSFGGPELTGQLLYTVAQTFLFCLLYISAFLFLSLAVSATTREPTIALVLLLAIWVLLIVAIPGISQLIVEQFTHVRGDAEELTEYQARIEEIRANAGPRFGDWNGDPFADFVVNRADYRLKLMALRKNILDVTHDQKMAQLRACLDASLVSPYGAIRKGLLSQSGGGVYGLDELHKVTERFQKQLYDYVASEDATEETPHLVYGTRRLYDPGVFTNKPISFESVPKSDTLWDTIRSQESPGVQTELWLIIIAFNLVFGMLALILLLRLDPR